MMIEQKMQGKDMYRIEHEERTNDNSVSNYTLIHKKNHFTIGIQRFTVNTTRNLFKICTGKN